jgi:hypothetical protein
LLAPVLIAVRRLDMVSFAAIFGVFAFFLLAVATRYYLGVVAILFLIDRKLLNNRFMLIMGVMLFASAGFDFFYFGLNDSDSLMYNIIIGVELTLVIFMVGNWLLFNPSLLDVGDDPRLPIHVPAQLGAVAAAVPLALAKKKKAKKKQQDKPKPPAALEADVETEVVENARERALEFDSDSASKLSIDRPAVTMPDGPVRAVLEADDDDDDDVDVDASKPKDEGDDASS